MEEKPKTPDVRNPPEGPALDDTTERGVHIINVPEGLILEEMHLSSLARGPVGTVTLSQVAKHIGQAAPTDIVVFAKQPWHFAGPAGQQPQLRAHPQVHLDYPETVLVLSIAKQQKAVWWSETPFTVTAVRPSRHPNPRFPEAPPPPPAPTYPFANPLVTRVEQWYGRDFFVVRSSVPVAAAARHMYKIAFELNGDTIDPDAYCAP